jgi:hypothetical protein
MPLSLEDVEDLCEENTVGCVKPLEQGERVMEEVAGYKEGGATGGFLELVDNAVSAAELHGYGPDQKVKRAVIRASATVQSDGRTFLTVVSSTLGLHTPKKFDQAMKLGGDFDTDTNDEGMHHNHHGTRACACNLGHKKTLANGRSAPTTAVIFIVSYQDEKNIGMIGAVGSCINANAQKETVICDSTRSRIVLQDCGRKFLFIQPKDVERFPNVPEICLQSKDKIIEAVANNGRSMKGLVYSQMGQMEDKTLDLVNPMIPLVNVWKRNGALAAVVQFTIVDIGTQDSKGISYHPSDCKVQVKALTTCRTTVDIMLHDGEEGVGDTHMTSATAAIGRLYDLRGTSIDVIINSSNVTNMQKNRAYPVARQAHLKILDNLTRYGHNASKVTTRHLASGKVAFTITAWLAPSAANNPLTYVGEPPGKFYSEFAELAEMMQGARKLGPAVHEKEMAKHVDTIFADDLAGGVVFVNVGKARRMISFDPTVAVDFESIFVTPKKSIIWDKIRVMQGKTSKRKPENQFQLTFSLLFFDDVELVDLKARMLLNNMLINHYKGRLIDCFTPAQLEMEFDDFHRTVKNSFMQKNLLGWRGRAHACPWCNKDVPTKAYEHDQDTAVIEPGGVPYATAVPKLVVGKDTIKQNKYAWWVTGLYCCVKCAKAANELQAEAKKKLAADAVLDVGNTRGVAYAIQHMWGNQYIQLIQHSMALTQYTVEWNCPTLFGAVSNSNKKELRMGLNAKEVFGKDAEEMRIELMSQCTGLVLNNIESKVHGDWIETQNVSHGSMIVISSEVVDNLKKMRRDLSKQAVVDASASKATSANNNTEKAVEEAIKEAKAEAEKTTAQAIADAKKKTEHASKALSLATREIEQRRSDDQKVLAKKADRQLQTRAERQTQRGLHASHFKTLGQKATDRLNTRKELRLLTSTPGDGVDGAVVGDALVVNTSRVDTHFKLFGYKLPSSQYLSKDDDIVVDKYVGNYVVLLPGSKIGDNISHGETSRAWNAYLIDWQTDGKVKHSADPGKEALPLESDAENMDLALKMIWVTLTKDGLRKSQYEVKTYKELFGVAVPCTSDGSLCDSVTGTKLVADDLTRKMKEINFTLKRSIVDNDSPSAPLTDSDDSVVGLPWSSGKRKAPITEETTAASKAARELPVAPGAAGSSTTPMELDAEEVNVPFPTAYVEELDE